MNGYNAPETNDTGQVTRSIHFVDPGKDGRWFTADDLPGSYYVYELGGPENSLKIRRNYYAGADDTGFTKDDVFVVDQ